MKRCAVAIRRREAGVHECAEESGEVGVSREGGLLGAAERRVREPHAEAAARRVVFHPSGDGHPSPEVHAGVRGRDRDDGPRVKRDVVAVGVAKRHVAVGVELDGDSGDAVEVGLALVGGGGRGEEAEEPVGSAEEGAGGGEEEGEAVAVGGRGRDAEGEAGGEGSGVSGGGHEEADGLREEGAPGADAVGGRGCERDGRRAREERGGAQEREVARPRHAEVGGRWGGGTGGCGCVAVLLRRDGGREEHGEDEEGEDGWA